MYKLNNPAEAEKIMTHVADSTNESEIRSASFHNLGNFNLAQKNIRRQ
jgi:hypothetical protein